MTIQCSSTANSIMEVLLAGDAVLNLTQQNLNTMPGTLFVSPSDDQLDLSCAASTVRWKREYNASLSRLLSGDVTRLVVISEGDCPDSDSVVNDLCARGIPHLHCLLMNSCDADAFMDDDDTEAVTERLRQLGYI